MNGYEWAAVILSSLCGLSCVLFTVAFSAIMWLCWRSASREEEEKKRAWIGTVGYRDPLA